MPPRDGSASPAAILAAAASAGRPWFPADYAAATGTDRDALYDPVTTLVNAGLLAVVDWQKGRGQAYRLTDAGAAVASDAAAVKKILAGPPVDVVPPEAVRDIGLTTFDRGELARAGLLTPRPPVIVPALILANAVWFLVGLYLAQRAGNPVQYLSMSDEPTLVPILHRLGAASGPDLLRGESWRLLATCFVHRGGLHLILNMYALAAVGAAAEGVFGRWRFAVLYAAAALGGSCLALALKPAGAVGASGALCGVAAGLGAWLLLNREFLPRDYYSHWGRRLAVFGVSCAGVSLIPWVSWEGHLGGAAGGAAAAVLLNAYRPGLARRRINVLVGGLMCLLPVACLLGLAAMMDRTAVWTEVKVRETARANAAVLAAAGPLLGPINHGAVEATYADVLLKGGRAKPRAAALAEKAAAAAGAIRALPVDPFGEPARAAAADYADRVKALADGLAAAEPDWDRLAEQKKLVFAAGK